MTELIDVVDALVAEMNATTWSQPFTAAKTLDPNSNLVEIGNQLRVLVRPVKAERVQMTRGKQIKHCWVEVCVRKRLAAGNLTPQVEPLVDLIEQIADHFDGVRLANRANSVCNSALADPPYDAGELDHVRQFTGVLTLEVHDWT